MHIFLHQGGRHVDYVTDQVIAKLLDIVKKKEKKTGVAIKPFQVRKSFSSIICIRNVFTLEKSEYKHISAFI
jgi:hypothetical protein